MENNTTYEKPRLTSLSTGSGCGCKIAPQALEAILKSIKPKANERLLLDQQHSDDAAVMALDDDRVLIMTNDFFTPIVDDPFAFGQIAAVNAINDIYAMGGKPFSALSILGWPVEQLGTETANAVLKGANNICNDLGIALAGGHSIESKEPFFGLAVNGIAMRTEWVANKGMNAGDLIYLTKPIGSGMMSSALKRAKLETTEINSLIALLTIPNSIGEGIGKTGYVRAMTDVTGFGLLGHGLEMCSDTLGLEIDFNAIPLIDKERIAELSAGFIVPNNTMRNFKAFHDRCSKLSAFQLHVLCDPQTSGGLLIAIDPQSQKQFEALLTENEIAVHRIAQAVKLKGDSPQVRII